MPSDSASSRNLWQLLGQEFLTAFPNNHLPLPSPTGRLLQVEYVSSLVAGSPTVAGAVCRDGVVLACLRDLGPEVRSGGWLAAAANLRLMQSY